MVVTDGDGENTWSYEDCSWDDGTDKLGNCWYTEERGYTEWDSVEMTIETNCDTWCQPFGGRLVRGDYKGGFYNDCDFSGDSDDKFAACYYKDKQCWEMSGEQVCEESCDTYCVPHGGRFKQHFEPDGTKSWKDCVFDNIVENYD